MERKMRIQNAFCTFSVVFVVNSLMIADDNVSGSGFFLHREKSQRMRVSASRGVSSRTAASFSRFVATETYVESYVRETLLGFISFIVLGGWFALLRNTWVVFDIWQLSASSLLFYWQVIRRRCLDPAIIWHVFQFMCSRRVPCVHVRTADRVGYAAFTRSTCWGAEISVFRCSDGVSFACSWCFIIFARRDANNRIRSWRGFLSPCWKLTNSEIRRMNIFYGLWSRWRLHYGRYSGGSCNMLQSCCVRWLAAATVHNSTRVPSDRENLLYHSLYLGSHNSFTSSS